MLGAGEGKAAVAPVEDANGLSAACFKNPGMTTTFHFSLPFYDVQVTG